VTEYFAALTGLLRLTGRIHGNPGLSPQLKFAWNEYGIMERLFPVLLDIHRYKAALQTVTAAITEGRSHRWTASKLRSEGACFIDMFRHERDGFVMRNQHVFREALAERSWSLLRTDYPNLFLSRPIASSSMSSGLAKQKRAMRVSGAAS
jgi:hypothetical protein